MTAPVTIKMLNRFSEFELKKIDRKKSVMWGNSKEI
jgi:hypothetical protein